ncbi:baseplate J/gp47 family protein [Klebsiella aerogenes]
MADTFITDTGLEKPTLAECVQEVGDSLESVVGPINREADSTTGQWVGVEAEANAVHFEALEHLWNSRFLNFATGMALDAIGTWFGISRNRESYTQVNAVIYGTESTLVPAGAIASFGNYQFVLTEASVISRTVLVDGAFRVNNATQASYKNPRAVLRYQDGSASGLLVATFVGDYQLSVPWQAAFDEILLDDPSIEPPRLVFCSSTRSVYDAIFEEIAPQADGTCQVTTRQYSDIFYQYDDANYPGSVS